MVDSFAIATPCLPPRISGALLGMPHAISSQARFAQFVATPPTRASPNPRFLDLTNDSTQTDGMVLGVGRLVSSSFRAFRDLPCAVEPFDHGLVSRIVASTHPTRERFHHCHNRLRLRAGETGECALNSRSCEALSVLSHRICFCRQGLSACLTRSCTTRLLSRFIDLIGLEVSSD
jgi:hypothetical protein